MCLYGRRRFGCCKSYDAKNKWELIPPACRKANGLDRKGLAIFPPTCDDKITDPNREAWATNPSRCVKCRRKELARQRIATKRRKRREDENRMSDLMEIWTGGGSSMEPVSRQTTSWSTQSTQGGRMASGDTQMGGMFPRALPSTPNRPQYYDTASSSRAPAHVYNTSSQQRQPTGFTTQPQMPPTNHGSRNRQPSDPARLGPPGMGRSARGPDMGASPFLHPVRNNHTPVTGFGDTRPGGGYLSRRDSAYQDRDEREEYLQVESDEEESGGGRSYGDRRGLGSGRDRRDYF